MMRKTESFAMAYNLMSQTILNKQDELEFDRSIRYLEDTRRLFLRRLVLQR